MSEKLKPCDKCTVKNEITGETKRQEKLHNPYACYDVPVDKCLLEKKRRESMENHVLLDPKDIYRSKDELTYMLHRYQDKYSATAELYHDEVKKTKQLQSEIDRLKEENAELVEALENACTDISIDKSCNRSVGCEPCYIYQALAKARNNDA